MDISDFRWILILLGIAIIAGIILFGNPDKKRKPKASRKRIHNERVRRDPVLDASVQAVDGPDIDTRQTELAIEPNDAADGRREPMFADATPDENWADEDLPEIVLNLDDKSQTPEGPAPDKIVMLYLRARDNNIITGLELLDVSLKSGLVFSEQGVFHRIHEEDIEPVFSMANLTNPGTFDKTAWNTVEIKGVTMFLTLPGPKNALDAWDSMLATSRRLAELLHADLLDDQREVFTRQRALLIKEELREYERQKSNQS